MKIHLFVLALFIQNMCYAQKYDCVWVIGDDNNKITTTHGGAIIDFIQQPVSAKYHYRELNMSLCNVSISDSSGKLLFYSNGCDIAGENDEILMNGNDLNPGTWHTILCDQNNDGYGSAYPGALILPKPDSQNIFFLFHQSVVYSSSPVEYAFVNKLLYTKIRQLSQTLNTSVVEEKNILLLEDSLSAGEMNAVKHANGKDWWIIQPRRNSNEFYILLFTKDGIVDTLTQTIGAISPPEVEGYGQTTFSPDGQKMIRYYPDNEIRLYEFDRSVGQFTAYSTFHLNTGNSIAFDGGCAFSPSSRYLYIAALTNVYQFDMDAPDISASQITVATWDGFVDPIAVAFWHCQLGPDCKIYIVGGGDTRYYHIIHNPDEPGLACNLQQRGLVLPTPSGASIPYFPNYRLGPIDNPGLPCSPVVAAHEPLYFGAHALQIYPNPTHESVSLQTLETENTLETAVFDLLGREVLHQSIPNGASLDVSRLPKGLYLIQAMGDSGKRYAGKVRKE